RTQRTRSPAHPCRRSGTTPRRSVRRRGRAQPPRDRPCAPNPLRSGAAPAARAAPRTRVALRRRRRASSRLRRASRPETRDPHGCSDETRGQATTRRRSDGRDRPSASDGARGPSQAQIPKAGRPKGRSHVEEVAAAWERPGAQVRPAYPARVHRAPRAFRGASLLLLVAALVASAAACTSAARPVRTGSLVWHSCGAIQCTTLSVPLDLSRPSGEPIQLAPPRRPAPGRRLALLF